MSTAALNTRIIIVEFIRLGRDISLGGLNTKRRNFDVIFLARMYAPDGCVEQREISPAELQDIAAVLDSDFQADLIPTPPWILAIEKNL
jgi:hypothetical protein